MYLAWLTAFLSIATVTSCVAADLAPYRALYSLALDSIGDGSDVVGAGGTMTDEWANACNGWIEREHYDLHLQYRDGTEDDTSDDSTWESKDARRFRFAETDTTDIGGESSREELEGTAALRAADKVGKATFSTPRRVTLTLAPHVLFPAAYTRDLIEQAESGKQFVARPVFDGTDVSSKERMTAFIGPKMKPGMSPDAKLLPHNPLLERPSWSVRFAFFPEPEPDGEPDHEQTAQLFDNGVLGSFILDYFDHTISATLKELATPARPNC